ncbi:MAG TPA: energy transducer TonB [Hydrogenophaga sp.]|uniref:energy transducer TonB n=1 Tax=Hydrogenophaga sp. TaxID=1904254 RepID=UPI002CD2EC66|nr:energy transducer TonB [Hydrogenophaga sp.]HMN93020.1 energy transducer TonB [Hydrogenophaga sp.]HMP10760.1 energy transducer TonB [Hydrogenophaga sp.]
MNSGHALPGSRESGDFKPPAPGHWSVPLTLAVLVHGALIVALAWGVNWNKESAPVAFEAELWSALPREAAPRAVQPPPHPPAPPAPRPAPPPPPPAPAPPVSREPDIATQQARQQAQETQHTREEEARRQEAQRRAAAERAEAERRRQEQQRQERTRQERERQEAERRAAAEAQATQQARDDQIRRMMGQAGATGAPHAQGTAERASGPSAGYASRVAARIRPNIVYTEDFPASLATEVEVRAAPDGTIMSRRVLRTSGNAAWDDAALRAIDRTGSLPRDTDGRVPSPLVIVVRPLD